MAGSDSTISEESNSTSGITTYATISRLIYDKSFTCYRVQGTV